MCAEHSNISQSTGYMPISVKTSAAIEASKKHQIKKADTEKDETKEMF